MKNTKNLLIIQSLIICLIVAQLGLLLMIYAKLPNGAKDKTTNETVEITQLEVIKELNDLR